MTTPSATDRQAGLLPYELVVTLPRASYPRLQKIKSKGDYLIRQDVDLDYVALTLTNSTASLRVMYWAYQSDGVRCQRRTGKTITFTRGPDGIGWLNELFPAWLVHGPSTRQAITRLWPPKQ